MKKTLIFTATYNEVENIKILVNLVFKNSPNVNLLVVDDNSPDLTFELLKKLKKKYKNLIIKKRPRKLGLDTAHKYAFNYARNKKYKKLITMDADLSHNPKLISRFIKYLDSNSFVIGSRYAKGGSCNINIFRFLLSYFGNKFIKFVLNIPSNEFTTSYRGFNLTKLDNFDLKEINSKGYSFFMETIYLINKKKHRIKEIPIKFNNRIYGISKIPKIEIFRTLLNVLRLKFSF
tara:strand:+ start:54 stop:752 length:699 start_codon:yes stop_codon:yes gene_type:complete